MKTLAGLVLAAFLSSAISAFAASGYPKERLCSAYFSSPAQAKEAIACRALLAPVGYDDSGISALEFTVRPARTLMPWRGMGMVVMINQIAYGLRQAGYSCGTHLNRDLVDSVANETLPASARIITRALCRR